MCRVVTIFSNRQSIIYNRHPSFFNGDWELDSDRLGVQPGDHYACAVVVVTRDWSARRGAAACCSPCATRGRALGTWPWCKAPTPARCRWLHQSIPLITHTWRRALGNVVALTCPANQSVEITCPSHTIQSTYFNSWTWRQPPWPYVGVRIWKGSDTETVVFRSSARHIHGDDALSDRATS